MKLILFKLNKNYHLTWVQLKIDLLAFLIGKNLIILQQFGSISFRKAVNCSGFHLHGPECSQEMNLRK